MVREALARFAGVDLPEGFAVQPVANDAAGVPEGLGWRTRGTASVDGSGRAGFRAHRGHEVVVKPAMGSTQSIMLLEEGFSGASDPRGSS